MRQREGAPHADVRSRRGACRRRDRMTPLPDVPVQGAQVKVQAADGEDDREGENEQGFHGDGVRFQ